MVMVVIVVMTDHHTVMIIVLMMNHDDLAMMVAIVIPIMVAIADTDGDACVRDHHRLLARCRRCQRRRAHDREHARDKC